jgi:hypothetical protein
MSVRFLHNNDARTWLLSVGLQWEFIVTIGAVVDDWNYRSNAIHVWCVFPTRASLFRQILA